MAAPPTNRKFTPMQVLSQIARRLASWLDRTDGPTEPARPRLAVETLEDRTVPSATDLGGAAQFNAFVFNAFNMHDTDAQGRLAVGGNATLRSYGVGTGIPNSHGTRDDLIVGGNVNYTWGQVFNGNLVAGGTRTLTGVGIPNGTARQQSGVADFAGVQADLTAKSALWGGLGPNGTVANNWGSLVLAGTNAKLNIFSLDASQLSGVYGLSISAPPTSTVLINVTGTSVVMQYMGITLQGGLKAGHVLFNFPQATSLTLAGVGVQGSVLAPNAAVKFDNGQLNGDLIASSLCGTGQLHNVPPCINIYIPKPASLAGLVFEDTNRNNKFDPPDEAGRVSVTVVLSGVDDLGRSVYRTTVTDGNGNFFFANLWPGTYQVTTTVDDPFEPGLATAGSKGGVAAINLVSLIPLDEAAAGIDYLFPHQRIRFG